MDSCHGGMDSARALVSRYNVFIPVFAASTIRS